MGSQIPRESLATCRLRITDLLPVGKDDLFTRRGDKGLQPHNVTVDRISYRGRNAVRLSSLPSADATYDSQKSGTGGGLVLVEGSTFHDFVREIDA